ncbi:MAG TPA: hypothetical protein VM307_04355, partial [Egibacteraceae bacterium]|nr:hypothetical protein [Egibacteraceae bacterium]
DLPELLEEFAGYFASCDRHEEAIAAAVHAVRLTSDGSEQALRRRARIAEILLRAGLSDEACAVYASIAEEAPGQTWVHEAAGSAYADAQEYDLALAWLTAGLELAVTNDESEACVRRLCGLRRIAMAELGVAADDLDGQACARFSFPEIGAAAAGPQTDDADPVLLADALDEDHVARGSALRLLHALRQIAQGDRTIVLPEPQLQGGTTI